MKTLDEFYGEIQNDEGLKEEFISSVRGGRADAFLKEHDCDAVTADVISYVRGLGQGELADDDLDRVAGGGDCLESITCNESTCY